MNLNRTLSVAHKEAIHILRDSRALYLALGIPVMLMFLFGYALSLDVDNIALAVWDQDRSPQSREIIDRLTGSGYFKIVLYTDGYHYIVESINERQASVGLVIPYDFAKDLTKDSGATLQVIVDGSDSTRATISLGYLNGIATIYQNELRLRELNRQAVPEVKTPVETRIRLLYNPELKSRVNIIPGLIAIIMMVIAALLTSLTIVREWESGTMEQLISTPVKAPELVVGKLIPYFALGYIDLVMVYLMSQYLFGVPFRGSVLLMFLLSSLFLIGALSLGLLVSVVADNQLFATQFALLGTFLPSFLLSGFVFPIDNMPRVVQLATYVVPARYYVTILRGIFLKGVGIEILLYPVLLLALFGLVTSVLAARRLGKKLR